jgi:hypothetical protein
LLSGTAGRPAGGTTAEGATGAGRVSRVVLWLRVDAGGCGTGSGLARGASTRRPGTGVGLGGDATTAGVADRVAGCTVSCSRTLRVVAGGGVAVFRISS